jgi:hypothetical protein
VVVGGKGKQEKVVYETNSVGAAVKMLREEFELQVSVCFVFWFAIGCVSDAPRKYPCWVRQYVGNSK